MRAFGFSRHGVPEEVLEEVLLAKPTPHGKDIVIKIKAGATNPIDFKVIRGLGTIENPPAITGYDGAGVVEAVGPEAKTFKVGDEVYFAGVVNRRGTFAECTAVDERLVAHKPKSLSFDQAACIPLVALTAWEALFEEMNLTVPRDGDEEKQNNSKVLLIIGGAGGVGSMATQIAKKILKLTVVATATRPESIDHCKKNGADFVIRHDNLVEDFKQIGLKGSDYVLNCDVPKNVFDQLAAVTNPFGRLVFIASGDTNTVDISKLFAKRIALHWELMFSRALYNVHPEYQGRILAQVADCVDKGVLHHNLAKVFPFTLAGIKEALSAQQSGRTMGKLAFHVAD